jgi:uncharacterized membrane protein
MPETAAFCPGCGRRMLPSPVVQGKAGIFRESVGGAVAYLTFIPAILFLFLEPFKRNRFVRFHSVQCLLLWGVGIVLALALKVATLILFLVPVAGPLLVTVTCVVLGLAAFVLWLVLIVKALQGEMFRLPVVGELAAQYSEEL